MIESDHASTVALVTNCPHSRSHVELIQGNSHHSHAICSDCCQHLYYMAKPSNTERRKQNAINIQKLLDSNRLTEWENGFCQGIHHNQRLTPRQNALLDQLVNKYLNRKATNNADTKRNGAPSYRYAA
jgi:hypothetical protein